MQIYIFFTTFGLYEYRSKKIVIFVFYSKNDMALNLYFDNGATSFPKPECVIAAVDNYLRTCGGTYSRGAYPRVRSATAMVETCRDLLAKTIGCVCVEDIIFTSGATMAANTLLFGLELKGKRVAVSPLEHNAIMRPLRELEKRGDITWEVLPHHSDGRIDLDALSKFDRTNLGLVIVNHVSNLNGVVQPIAKIKEWAGDIAVAVDAAQSAGHVTINVDRDKIDYLILTAHKGLMGITGAGALFCRGGNVKPLLYGGTSTASHSIDMPTSFPEGMEAGTPPMTAIAALKASLENPTTALHTIDDLLEAIEILKQSNKYKIYCANDSQHQSGLFSITHTSKSVWELAEELFSQFGIETRSGMLCAPLAQESLGSQSEGVVRISLSHFHTKQDIEYLTNSLLEI